MGGVNHNHLGVVYAMVTTHTHTKKEL